MRDTYLFYQPFGVQYNEYGYLAEVLVLKCALDCELTDAGAKKYKEHKDPIHLLNAYVGHILQLYGVMTQEVLHITKNGARGSEEAKVCHKLSGLSHSFGDCTFAGTQGCKLVRYRADGKRLACNVVDNTVTTLWRRTSTGAYAYIWAIDVNGRLYDLHTHENAHMRQLANALSKAHEKNKDDLVLCVLPRLAAMGACWYTNSYDMWAVISKEREDHAVVAATEMLGVTAVQQDRVFWEEHAYMCSEEDRVLTQRVKSGTTVIRRDIVQMYLTEITDKTYIPPNVKIVDAHLAVYNRSLPLLQQDYAGIQLDIKRLNIPLCVPQNVGVIPNTHMTESHLAVRIREADEAAATDTFELTKAKSTIDNLYASLCQFYNTLIFRPSRFTNISVLATRPIIEIRSIAAPAKPPCLTCASLVSVTAGAENKMISLKLEHIRKAFVVCRREGEDAHTVKAWLGGDMVFLPSAASDTWLHIKSGALALVIPPRLKRRRDVHILGNITCLTIDIAPGKVAKDTETMHIYVEGNVQRITFTGFSAHEQQIQAVARNVKVHVKYSVLLETQAQSVEIPVKRVLSSGTLSSGTRLIYADNVMYRGVQPLMSRMTTQICNQLIHKDVLVADL